MDRISFELAPREDRIRAVAILAGSLALQLIALFLAPWFTARMGDDSFSVHVLNVPDAPALTVRPSSFGHTLAAIVMLLLGLRYLVSIGYVGVTTILGRPLVRRGLFRSKLVVAWKSPTRAHIHTFVMLALAIYTAIDVPRLEIRDTDLVLPATLHYSWGGIAFVLAFVVGHVGIYIISRDPLLAAVQCWAEPASAHAPESPVRVSRPMIKSPLPPAPTNVSDPFRAPPRSPSLEDRLVRPALPTSTPAVVAGENVDEPSLLR